MKQIILITWLVIATFTNAAIANDDVTMTDAWLRVAPNNVVGGFFDIVNGSDEDLKIVSVAAEGATTVEMHSHKMAKGIMKMRKEEYVELPAMSTVSFNPHGFHLMMFKLDRDKFRVGSFVNVVLTLSDGSEVDASFLVKKFGK